jgi:Flp pilus assembly protein protease CpaA
MESVVLKLFVLVIATIAGYFDWRWHRIPNWLVVLTIVCAVSWHAIANGLGGVWASVTGLLLGTGVLFPLFLLRGMGAGDVKFFGALAAAVTYPQLFTILVAAVGIAAAAGLYRVIRHGVLRQTLKNVGDLVGRFFRGHLSPHPVVDVGNKHAVVVHFTACVSIATWIFVVFS